jgi:DNA-binding NarL/FixJ family response regulator
MRALLKSTNSMEVAGEAGTGDEAVEMARQLQPDVILMDIQMPGASGIEATRRVLAASPDIGIIMVTMYEDGESVFAAMRSGARGYVLKGAGQDELVRAEQAVANGEALYSAGIARRLLNFFQLSRRQLPHDVFPDLTARELEILDLMTGGLGNRGIASRLGIAEKTVRNNVSNIFGKLQVTDRVAAVIRARGAGLGDRS